MFRPAVIASLGFAAAAAAGVLALSLDHDDSSDLAPPPVVGEQSLAGSPAGRDHPVVDVVRVGEAGDAMIAGRAAPKSEIVILADERELGRATADDRGEWVFVPSLPFGAGALQLSLKDDAGASEAPVVLVVPATDHGGAFAFKSAPGQASRLLLAPSNGEGALALAISLVDRDRDGRLYVSGRAEPDAAIHLYLDNRFVGPARANANGDWLLAVRAPPQGTHTLRADQIGAKGKVLLRVERPWRSGEDLVTADQVVAAGTEEGWRVIRRTADGGIAYVTVYHIGRGQIRDSEIIYPGQVISGPGS
jgi:hypothetical protein